MEIADQASDHAAQAVRGHRLTPNLVRMLLSVPAAALLAIGYLGLAFAAIYLLSIIVGLFIGAALPTTMLIKWSPLVAAAARLEPELPYVVLMLCLAGAAASRHKASSNDREDRLARLYGRWGFCLILALYVFSASTQWAGILRPGDLAWASIAGLLPLSDAGHYFADASDSALRGIWSDFAARRPMAAATRASLGFLSGYGYSIMVLLQAVMLAVATFLASAAVWRWRGIWAALAFAAVTVITVENYVPTALTEPLGLFWALLAVPPLLHALRTKSLASALLGLALLTVALLTRMGAMFVAPALALWIAWCFGDTLVQKVQAAALAGIVLLAVAGTNRLLVSTYTDGQDRTGSNFAYTLCGISIGEDWSGCLDRYKAEVAAQPNERALVHFLYAKAFDNVRSDPETFAARLWAGASWFALRWPSVLLRGYMFVTPPWWFRQWLFVSLCALATGVVLVGRSNREERLFWLLFAAGTIASAAFVYFDDGGRVLVASYPLLTVALTMGLVGPRRSPPTASVEEHALSKAWPIENGCSLAIAAIAFMGSVILPAVASRLALSTPGVNIAQRQGEHVVFGGRRLSGFLVTGDDIQPSFTMPTVTFSAFQAIVKQSNVENYERLLTPDAPPIPFGLVAGERIERGTRSGFLYIVPAEVVHRPDVPLWRFTLSDRQVRPGEPRIFYRVMRAEPARLD
jgi:hypothetical protein